MKKLAIIIFIITVLSCTSGCTSQADYDRLVTDYNGLVDEYNELLATHNNLVEDYNELNTQFRQYVEEVGESVKKLEEMIPELLEGAVVPPYLLVKSREVNLVFRNLAGDVEYWQWDTEAVEASVILGWFMREMSISDLQYLRLYELANKFTTGTKYIGDYILDKGLALCYTS